MKRVAYTVLLCGAAFLFSGAFVAKSGAEHPRREMQVVEFRDTIELKGALLKGEYLIVHDEIRMSRGEPCTYVYRGKSELQEKLVVAFHCEHVDRPKAKAFTVTLFNPHTPYAIPEMREYQFANSADGHRVP